jgi:hypothetical protein
MSLDLHPVGSRKILCLEEIIGHIQYDPLVSYGWSIVCSAINVLVFRCWWRPSRDGWCSRSSGRVRGVQSSAR